jgi:hypothetical protein
VIGYNTLWCAGCEKTYYCSPLFGELQWTAWDHLNHHVRHDREHRQDREHQKQLTRDDYDRYLRERGVI